MRIIVAVTGASGTIYAVRLLRACRDLGIETHLIVTEAAEKVAAHEIGGADRLRELADHVYGPDELEAPMARGRFRGGARGAPRHARLLPQARDGGGGRRLHRRQGAGPAERAQQTLQALGLRLGLGRELPSELLQESQ